VNFNWVKKTHNIRFGADFYRMGLNHAQAEFITGGFGAQGGFGFAAASREWCEAVDPATGNCQRPPPAPVQQRGRSCSAGQPRRQNAAGARRVQRAGKPLQLLRPRPVDHRRQPHARLRHAEHFPLPSSTRPRHRAHDVTTNKVALRVGDIPTDCGIKASKTLFAPRVGMAYRIGDTWSSARATA
jgi:hypothetical protein